MPRKRPATVAAYVRADATPAQIRDVVASLLMPELDAFAAKEGCVIRGNVEISEENSPLGRLIRLTGRTVRA